MADLLDHLRKAATLLTQDDELRHVILSACDEFWAAMYDTSELPAESLEKAERIVEQILQDGPIHTTVPKLDDDAIRKIADDIQQLVAEVESARGEQSPST